MNIILKIIVIILVNVIIMNMIAKYGIKFAEFFQDLWKKIRKCK